MKDRIKELFEGIELENRIKIYSLMDDWRKQIASQRKIRFKDDNIKYHADEYFNSDGFFPGYYKQKTKVLFIGRETRGMSGDDYIATAIKYYRNDGHNKIAFTRHILYMVQVIKNGGKISFDDLYYPDEYAKMMAKETDYGFAVMNISKYSNDSKDGAVADKILINRFLEDSNLQKRNFFKEELSILQPDIIITGNLFDGKIKDEYLQLCFGELKTIKSIKDTATLSEMRLNNKKVKLIDTFHFSSRKRDKEYFYDPIIKLLYK
jgi:hypothetical protein